MGALAEGGAEGDACLAAMGRRCALMWVWANAARLAFRCRQITSCLRRRRFFVARAGQRRETGSKIVEIWRMSDLIISQRALAVDILRETLRRHNGEKR